MKKYDTFLGWTLRFILMTIGLFPLTYAGVWQELWREDVSKISFLIITIFGFFTFSCGFFSYLISSQKVFIKKWQTRFKHFLNHGWFWATRFTSLGMIGTVIGFIILLGGQDIESLSGQDIESFKKFVTNMSTGLGTALYTTLTGLVCAFLLRLQLMGLESGYLVRKKSLENE
jgi:hypothetical protein